MSDLIDTGEMYLKTVYELEEEGVPPLRARIAERLGHSGPTVSETVARLGRDGLLNVGQSRQLELTDKGRQIATEVMRKHRLAERLLVDVIGLEWQFVHDEACRWEHVMSDRVAAQLTQVLPDTQTDPYGNPIPHMAAGPGQHNAIDNGLCPITEVIGDEKITISISRLAEPLQTDIELLTRLHQIGAVPGGEVFGSMVGKSVRLENAEGEFIDVWDDEAKHIFTRA